ncbi:MAG: hypothetical protein IPI87_12265 [Betaproteobacteria bacterium]|nr:hypothetical protein [Betaproteobacteria bacterium]
MATSLSPTCSTGAVISPVSACRRAAFAGSSTLTEVNGTPRRLSSASALWQTSPHANV